jgi:putative phage-type endonuclease
MENQTRAEWLADRQTGIGGSDIAAILGLSKWRTPLDVYLDKRGESAPQDENEAMHWGNVHEAAIRSHYEAVTGRTVTVPGMIRGEATYQIANVDGITNDGRVLEIKTARYPDGWGEPGTDQVPVAYLLQVQWYMLVTDIPVADVAVLIGGNEFRLYEVPADPELQEMMETAAAEFWQCVVNGTPPAPASLAEVQQFYGSKSAPTAVEAGADIIAAHAELVDLKDKIAELEARESDLKAAIMICMGENDTLTADGRTIATWKMSAGRKSFDAAALKAAHPDLHAQFSTIGEPSRRFLLK